MKRLGSLQWPLMALVAVLMFNGLATPGFLSLTWQDGRLIGSLVDVLNRAAPVTLLALGMTLVIATGGVDLSVGAVMAISGAVAACLVVRPDGSPLSALTVSSFPLVVGISIAAAVVCGLFNGCLVGYAGVQPIVATLLLMVAGRGVAQLLTNGQIITFQHEGFAQVAGGSFLALPRPVWLAALGFATFGLLTRGTALGLFIEAVGDNHRAARIVGIDDRRVKLAVYALAAFCAGVAGLVATSDIKAADSSNCGLYLELDAILAVAIGGTAMTGGRFSLAGTVLGAMLMQTVTTTIYTRGVSTEVTLIAKAVIVVAVCLIQAPAFRAAVGSWRERQAA